MIRFWVPLLVLLSTCAKPPAAAPVAAEPPPSVVCPRASRAPPALPRFAPADRLAQIAVDQQHALFVERIRSEQCADAVRTLNAWIKDKQ